MCRRILLLLIVFSGLKASAQDNAIEEVDSVGQDSITLSNVYLQRLQQLVCQRDSIDSLLVLSTPNPYYYQLLTRPTLYASPMHQLMSPSADDASGDIQMRNLAEIRRLLAWLYVKHPTLVEQTETEVKEKGTFRDDVNEKIETRDRLAEKVIASSLAPTMDEDVVVVTRRPNFWKFTGNTALQFSQNHFSENWFQGGDDNYTGNLSGTLKLNFNNQKKITWDNTLEYQLGFQTTGESDERRSFRPTSNRIVFNTNFGYRAFKNFYYSSQVRIQTQIVPTYQANTDRVTSDIFSPMYVTIAPGMKYDIKYGKRKRFTGALNIAPLAYAITYVDRDNLVTNYGVKKGHNSSHSFGPSITLNTTWVICNQVRWTSNIYWFSNLELTRIEWTNTFNFQLSKLISAQLFLFPRFDDSSTRKNKDGELKFLMFKQYFSLGLNYNF